MGCDQPSGDAAYAEVFDVLSGEPDNFFNVASYEGAREMGDGSWHYLFINWFLKPMRSTDCLRVLIPTKEVGYIFLFHCTFSKEL